MEWEQQPLSTTPDQPLYTRHRGLVRHRHAHTACQTPPQKSHEPAGQTRAQPTATPTRARTCRSNPCSAHCNTHSCGIAAASSIAPCPTCAAAFPSVIPRSRCTNTVGTSSRSGPGASSGRSVPPICNRDTSGCVSTTAHAAQTPSARPAAVAPGRRQAGPCHRSAAETPADAYRRPPSARTHVPSPSRFPPSPPAHHAHYPRRYCGHDGRSSGSAHHTLQRLSVGGVTARTVV